ncbi:TFIIH/NER complex subunit [Martiniozyma asiatica (nom. inval.)]|nr:TFIIH/NER complex subunit [Martiniozyma asiatica]
MSIELDWNNVSKDLCPVCKTDKYLSPEIQFKINPECYHKICDACVDRLFSLGPAQCPYPQCDKILRKNKFKTQVFEDIKVERECDIRRRVLSVYNKKESDFPTLDDWNKYEEEVEDIVWKFMNNVDLKETEEKLREYSLVNKQSIELNNAKKDQEYEKFIRLQKLERQYKSERNRLNREIMTEEGNLKKLAKEEVVNQLQNAAVERDTDLMIDQIKENMLRKTNKYKEELRAVEEKYERQKEAIKRNLSDKPQKKEKVPFTPFNGDHIDTPFTFHFDYYKDPFNREAANEKIHKAGGYRLDLFFKSTLVEAFTATECFIEDMKAN